MQDWENYIWLISGFFGGLVPPILILIMTNDEKARVECLNLINELSDEFEELSRLQRTTARSVIADHCCLIDIKNILQKISIRNTSLTFSYYPMDRDVEKCLTRIRRMDSTDQNPFYHPVQTGTRVLLDWGKTERRCPEFPLLKNIEWFLQRSTPMRFVVWLIYLPVKLKEMISWKLRPKN